ncbi:methylcobalamin:coenzyme M methyltransferase [uncultured Roseburia sp.]|uniref:Uroporphyrinogen decarboxylase (URO-D) domain-containing protein n=1 Tax=Brotonthovivens ammoniilytica TaxID=2981725 RepID=A0ABT2TG02_9FIRM|nr:uroporphyrinogen decarboxylase family protein [Brotonthovivens ammoniilytica]MCU6761125.1 hypothetical protein [Brotonthovivens ammoniilytica]SCI19620.1 methylcobalamin:coenzyme M methyltransferase [uncultured Roseburia sp.]
MTPRENLIRTYEHKLPAYVPNAFTDYDVWFAYGERYFGEGTGKDWFGVEWTYTPQLNSQTVTPGQEELEDLENWKEHITFPDLSSYDWETIALEGTKNWDRTNRMSLCMFLNGPFERLMTLMGFENALCAFLETPDEVHEFFQALTEYKCEYLDILKKYFNFDIIVYHDDWGNNGNMFFSMDMWKEFLMPYIQKVIDHTHKLGMIFEMHSCGYIEPAIPYLAEMGIDALQPLQFCNDVATIKEKFGSKIVLNGAFDTQGVLERPGASEEEIRREVRRTIDVMAPGGNFSTAVPIIDPRVTAIVSDEIDHYGKAFYSSMK